MSTCEPIAGRPAGVPRRTRVWVCQLFFAAIACGHFWPRDAAASEIFPPKIREHLGLTADPPCTICHATDEGEDDTVVKPFGVTMVRLGVHGDSDTQSLIAALDAAETQQLDSDFDGIPDITELRDGSDPNDGKSLPIPQTGCSIEPASVGSDPVFVVVAGIALACARRRRRSSPGVAQLANRSPRQCRDNATRLKRDLRKVSR